MLEHCSTAPSVEERLNDLERSISRIDELEVALDAANERQTNLENRLDLVSRLSIDIDTLSAVRGYDDGGRQPQDVANEHPDGQVVLTPRNLHGLFEQIVVRLQKLEINLKEIEKDMTLTRANDSGIIGGLTCLPARLPKLQEEKTEKPSHTNGKDEEEVVVVMTETGDDKVEDAKNESDFAICSSFVNKGTVAKMREDVYELRESVWDITPFLGHPVLGGLGSVYVLFILFLTVFVTVVFTGIIMQDFTDSAAFGEGFQLMLKRWRTHFGHLLDNSDPVTGTSLVAAVCNLDRSLMTSSPHVEIVDYLTSYLPSENGGVLSHILCGPMLCILALFVWYLTLTEEITTVVNLTRGLLYQKITWGLTITQLHLEGRTIVMRSLSWHSLLTGMAFSAVRFSICVFLAIAGTSYILHTVSMQDLILNCAALQIVLDMDELIFDVLMPLHARCLIKTLDPLPMRPWPETAGLDSWSVFTFLVIATCISVVGLHQLKPFIDDLYATVDILCAGDQNFVVKTDITGRPWAARSNPYGQDVPAYERIVARSVAQAREGNFDDLVKAGNFSWGGFRVQGETYYGVDNVQASAIDDVERLRRMTHKEKFHTFYVYSPSYTADGQSQKENAAVVHLRKLMQNESVLCDGISQISGSRSCYQFWDEYVETTLRIQAICPIGCGCSSIFMGTLYKQLGGCPVHALDAPSLQNELANLPCEDPSGRSGSELQKIYDWMQGPEMKDFCDFHVGIYGPCPDPTDARFCDIFYHHFHSKHTMLPAICPGRFGCKHGNVSETNIKFCPKACPYSYPVVP